MVGQMASNRCSAFDTIYAVSELQKTQYCHYARRRCGVPAAMEVLMCLSMCQFRNVLPHRFIANDRYCATLGSRCGNEADVDADLGSEWWYGRNVWNGNTRTSPLALQ